MAIRKFLSNLSIQNKFLVINLAVTTTALSFAVIMAVFGEYLTKRDFIMESLNVQAKMVASNTTAALVFKDEKGAEDILQAFISSPQVHIAAIYDAQGGVLASYIRQGIKNNISDLHMSENDHDDIETEIHQHKDDSLLSNKIHINQEISFEGDIIGNLFIEADISGMYSNIINYLIYTTIVALIGLSLASLLLLKLRKSITAPLQNLSGLMDTVIQKNDYSVRVEHTTDDEIGILSRGFNEMLSHIQVNDEKLAHELSERYRAEEHLDKLAYYDVITDLPNRHFFHEHLERTVEHAITTKQVMALLFLDLDNFKIVNDTLGHKTGDMLLKQASSRLSNVLRKNDYICRIGGDEFAIIVENINHVDDISIVSEKCIDALSNPFVFEGNNFFIGVSIGISICPEDATVSNDLLVNADMAMYEAKLRGKNNYQYFNKKMNDEHSRKFQLESDLRHAIDKGQLELYYQPQVDSHDETLCGIEALMRWHHPEKGMISPGEFIPIAEETGLIPSLGQWLINTACEDCNRLVKAGITDVSIAINISGIQIRDNAFIDTVRNALDTFKTQAGLLEFELTESILMDDSSLVIDKVNKLRAMGILVAIDDFGTGFSSMSYLKSFPINKLKIDRSFISGLPQSSEDTSITRAIIAMAHGMNIGVVAEGVEHADQIDFLCEHDCDVFQGYYYAKPMPLAELLKLYEQRRRADGHFHLARVNI
ncbi:MAG: EAL domain-containing protein [Gammaproteobacteria bacterium]|nr:EAL domain-containing protein [Gammaproteobacteria bacterium]NNJ50305.1 EAL domain-containing protein [Gammaproteobacteria bacterium]